MSKPKNQSNQVMKSLKIDRELAERMCALATKNNRSFNREAIEAFEGHLCEEKRKAAWEEVAKANGAAVRHDTGGEIIR